MWRHNGVAGWQAAAGVKMASCQYYQYENEMAIQRNRRILAINKTSVSGERKYQRRKCISRKQLWRIENIS